MAAMKVCFITGLRIMTVGVLMFLGVMHAPYWDPGDIPTTFREHGFALTYYSGLRQSPGSLAVVLAPLARLGESWVWGAVGGSLGRTIARRWARPGGRATADPAAGDWLICVAGRLAQSKSAVPLRAHRPMSPCCPFTASDTPR